MNKFLSLLAVVLSIGVRSFAADKITQPNIIFILADDLGIGNVSCYGADNFKTPRIDALAKGGIRFDHCYAQPLCGPSRAELLTGRYAYHTGMTGNDSGHLLKPDNETMIPRVLKPAGYVSGMAGKWGQLPLQPSDFGFDEYLRFQGSGVYWADDANGGVSYTENGVVKKLPKKKYMPDLMHEFTVDFIKRHRDQPFYFYYSMSHVHRNVPHLGMRPTPDSSANSKNLFADNIDYMDKLVGQLVDELEHLKLREKTLLIFAGDNGTAGGEYEQSTVRGRLLSGHKGDMLEGGSLVPMIANWPGTVPTGKVSTDLIDFSDYLPTFAELAGVKLNQSLESHRETGRPNPKHEVVTGLHLPSGTPIDGRSFTAQLLGKKGDPRDWIFVELGRHWYAREANWKLHENGELFDMRGAPFEEKLISPDSPDSSAARKRLQTVLDQLSPATGKVDPGDGSGRHDKAKKAKKKKNQAKV